MTTESAFLRCIVDRAPLRLEISRGLVVCCLILIGGIEASLAESSDLRAGVSRIDITPTHPVRMGGYESRKDPSQGVHDPLGARVLALEKNAELLVLVSVDTLGFYNDTAEPLRRGILEECNLKPSELFLCAIHTHSSPILNWTEEKVLRMPSIQGRLGLN